MTTDGDAGDGPVVDADGDTGVAVGYVAVPGDLTTTLDRADRAGADFVELHMDGPGAHDRIDVDRTRSALSAADLDLLVHLPFSGIAVGSPHEAVRRGSVDCLRATLDVAGELGARLAVLHAEPRAAEFAWDRADLWAPTLSAVRELHAAGAGAGVELTVENLPSGLVRTATADRLLRETPADLTLDTGHATVEGLDADELADWAGERADRIAHVHCNDTRGDRDEHLPVGAGAVDFPGLFEALADAGWSGTASAEVVTDDGEHVVRSVRRVRAAL